jgi:hypothetical protein
MGLHNFRGSSNGRSRVGGASFSDGYAYDDKERAGYEDAGPGILRLSAAVVIEKLN